MSKVSISHDNNTDSDASNDDIELDSDTGDEDYTESVDEDSHTEEDDELDAESTGDESSAEHEGSEGEEDSAGVVGSAEEEDLAGDEGSAAIEDSPEGNGIQKAGWADALSKLLHRKAPEKVILSKGQTDREIRKRKALKTAEEAGEKFVDEDDIKRKKEDNRLKLLEWRRMANVKPDILNKPYEKDLQKIAMRGVVQLFNAVQKQQKTVSEKLKSSGKTEAQKERALQSMKKGDFLDMLKVKAKDKKAMQESKELEPVSEKQAWLADDFMMQASMKDWEDVRDSSENSGGEESS